MIPAFFIFLLKVNISLILFCLGYFLVLRRLTFYTLNRFFLLAGIGFSTLYPLIDLSPLFSAPEQLIIPIPKTVVYRVATEAPAINYWLYLQLIFWLGVVLMMCRMAIRLFSLYRVHQLSVPAQVEQYKVRLLKGTLSTFSFWKQIYLNPAQHQPEELDAVLEHEQVHVQELHTLDILLAEFATVFYWFNPGVWFMRKAVKENVEFITDHKILQKGIDRKSYQYSMLYTGAGVRPSALMNNFNLTAIKRRIVMMNSKRSSSFQLLRYALLLPFLIVVTTAFALIRTEISSSRQEKPVVKLTEPARLQKQITIVRKKERKHSQEKVSTPFKATVLPDSDRHVQVVSVVHEPQEDTTIHKRKINIIFKSNIGPGSPNGDSKTRLVYLKVKHADDGTQLTAEATPTEEISMSPGRTFLNDKEVSMEMIKQIKPSEILRMNVVKNKDDAKKSAIYIYTVDFKN